MSQVRRYAAAGLDAAVAGRVALDQCQARLYTAILRHFVPVMAALAICAVTAARLRDRTNGQAAPPTAHRRT